MPCLCMPVATHARERVNFDRDWRFLLADTARMAQKD